MNHSYRLIDASTSAHQLPRATNSSRTHRHACSRTAVVLVLCTLLVATSSAQQRTAAPLGDYIGRAGMPSIISIQVQQLGDRTRVAGKERVVLSGTLTDSRGTAPAHLIYQLPDNFRLQTTGPGARVLAFDGSAARGSRGQPDGDDEAVLESLASDFPDALFHELRQGGSLRLLGLRFRPKESVAPNYKGPLYDIYDFAGTVRARADKLRRPKRLYFDSNTALLLSVRYLDDKRPAKPRIETRFSDWRDFAGSPLPQRIERIDDGKVVLTFQVTAAAVQPGSDKGIFRQAN